VKDISQNALECDVLAHIHETKCVASASMLAGIARGLVAGSFHSCEEVL